MKRNIYGIIITILSVVNVLYMIYCYIIYEMGINNQIYIIGGTIISILLLILILKNKLYGYIGTIIFYGVQMLESELIFENFRYGVVFRSEYDLSINSTEFQWDFNFTSILIVILGIFGSLRLRYLNKSISEK